MGGPKYAGVLLISAMVLALVIDLSDITLKSDNIAATRYALLQISRPERRQSLWIVPDNGVVTTINTRGFVNADGTLSYNSNFVYGPAGTAVIEPNPVTDQVRDLFAFSFWVLWIFIEAWGALSVVALQRRGIQDDHVAVDRWVHSKPSADQHRYSFTDSCAESRFRCTHSRLWLIHNTPTS